MIYLENLVNNLISFTNPSWQQVVLILGILIIDVFRCEIKRLIERLKNDKSRNFIR